MAVHVRVDLVWEDIKYSVDSLSGKLSILEGLSGYAKGNYCYTITQMCVSIN